MIAPGWRLGPHRYVPVPSALPDGLDRVAAGCTWSVVRRDGEGPRCLLQLWRAPTGVALDSLREAFLQRFRATTLCGLASDVISLRMA